MDMFWYTVTALLCALIIVGVPALVILAIRAKREVEWNMKKDKFMEPVDEPEDSRRKYSG